MSFAPRGRSGVVDQSLRTQSGRVEEVRLAAAPLEGLAMSMWALMVACRPSRRRCSWWTRCPAVPNVDSEALHPLDIVHQQAIWSADTARTLRPRLTVCRFDPISLSPSPPAWVSLHRAGLPVPSQHFTFAGWRRAHTWSPLLPMAMALAPRSAMDIESPISFGELPWSEVVSCELPVRVVPQQATSALSRRAQVKSSPAVTGPARRQGDLHEAVPHPPGSPTDAAEPMPSCPWSVLQQDTVPFEKRRQVWSQPGARTWGGGAVEELHRLWEESPVCRASPR